VLPNVPSKLSLLSIPVESQLGDETNSSLSVVIALANGLPIIGECLDRLLDQDKTIDLEIIVASRCPKKVGEYIQQQYPKVTLIKADAETSIPQLRALGFRKSSGDIVAVLEDHCLAAPDWAKRVIDAHSLGYPVVGGSVENAAGQRLVDWAAFFCEYYRAMKPIPEGPVDFVPGNNVSYKREILRQFHLDIEAGVWDFTLHEHIKNAGLPLYSVPSISVNHKLSASLGWFISQKFHFARSFAGTRRLIQSWARCTLYGAGAFLLPVIQLGRIFSVVWKKGRHRIELLFSLPFLFLLLLSWGIGEAAGYTLGPGSSMAKVA
jgi:glycosyltransferase involved in cell wall biosynthesis